jgi:hypothetical protein
MCYTFKCLFEMTTLTGGYTREQAIADGVLIDVSSTIGADLGLPCPVAVSAALWGRVARDYDRLAFVIRAGLRRFYGREVGEFSYNVAIRRSTYATCVGVQVVVEPSQGGGVVATFLEAHEDWDLRSPRAGSFYTV